MAPTSIQGVATSITAFVAPAPEGPTGTPIRVANIAEFEQQFGSVAAGTLGAAMSLFFANGGTTALVVRVPAREPTAVSDYGDPAAGSGLYSLDTVETFNLLCLPSAADDSNLAGLYQLAAAYCEKRQALLLADLPRTSSVADAQNWLRTTGSTIRSRNVATYYPGLIAGDAPPAPISGLGAVAGVFARNDAVRGVWHAPAGTSATIVGAVGLQQDLTDSETAALNAEALNCLRFFPETGMVIWGDRTMAGADGGTDEYKYVPVRRLALFIEQSIQIGTRWAVFEPNAPALWAQIATAVGAFLQQLFSQGAFAGATPGQSFFVRCDNTTMSEADLQAGIINIVVGFAPLRPAEFVILTIRQTNQP
jgi:phage tail sheath protein FI